MGRENPRVQLASLFFGGAMESIIASEQAVIGATALNYQLLKQVKDQIKPEWFGSARNKLLFQAILDLGPDSDLASIIHECNLDKDGQDYLFEILDKMQYIGASINYHINTIKESFQRRTIKSICSSAASKSEHNNYEISEICKSIEAEINNVISCSIEAMEDNKQFYNRLHDMVYEGMDTHGIDIGFNGCKIMPRTTFVIAAESGVGKSAFALNIADNIDKLVEGNGLYFTLESYKEALGLRRICMNSGIPLSSLRHGHIHDKNKNNLQLAIYNLKESRLAIIDDNKYRYIEDLEAFCESYAMKNPLKYIIVDFIQQMYSHKRTQSRHLELSYISDRLNCLAKSLNIPVIYLSQLRKDIDGRPTLDQLKESGDIRNNADNICFLWSPDQHDSNVTYQYHVEAFMAKCKDSERWSQWYNFNGSLMSYTPDNEYIEIKSTARKGF